MMSTQRKYRCRKCGIDMPAGPYIAPEMCSACQLAANAEGTRRVNGGQDLLMQLRMRPYSNPQFWMLEAADEIERLQKTIERLQAILTMADSPRDTTLRQDFQDWWKANEEINRGWDRRVIAKRAWYAATTRTRKWSDEQQAEIERLRSYTDAYNTLLAERVEVECLRGLAIRAWHSFRSGLSATGGCRDGLTDGDILELVRLSNVEAAKLRGHGSVAATIAEIERQAKIPRMPNEREDEPIE